jgi:hypothetical protein
MIIDGVLDMSAKLRGGWMSFSLSLTPEFSHSGMRFGRYVQPRAPHGSRLPPGRRTRGAEEIRHRPTLVTVGLFENTVGHRGGQHLETDSIAPTGGLKHWCDSLQSGEI